MVYDMIYNMRYLFTAIGSPPVSATLMYRFKIDLFYPAHAFNDTASKTYRDNSWHFQFTISVLHNFNSTTEARTKWVVFAKRSGHWKCHIKIQRFVHFRQLFDPSERAGGREGHEKLSSFLSSRGWRMQLITAGTSFRCAQCHLTVLLWSNHSMQQVHPWPPSPLLAVN